MPIDDMFEVELLSGGTWRIGARYDSAEAAKAEALRSLDAGRGTMAVRVVKNSFDDATQVYKQVTILKRDRAGEGGAKAPAKAPVDKEALADRYEQRRAAVAKKRQAASQAKRVKSPNRSGLTRLCVNTACAAMLIGIVITALNYLHASLQ